MTAHEALLEEVRACTLCLVAGQAPGRKVHASGIPWDDASGKRLRAWLGLPPEVFYDMHRVAIVPMGLCYPGTGRSGDLPRLELTLAIGQYAHAYHLPRAQGSVTQLVGRWEVLA